MSIFVATPNAVYYERQTLFTVLVWISALGSIAGMIHSMVRLFCYGFDLALMNILCLLFVLVWAIKILGKEDFFFTGDLNKKCLPWIFVAGYSFLAGLGLVLDDDKKGITFILSGVIYVLIYLCYRYWSFFRPWKQVQLMPSFTVQEPAVVVTLQVPEIQAHHYTTPSMQNK